MNFKIKGAIFDVDDTLLDNKIKTPLQGLHERSRLAATHEVGKRHGIRELSEFSAESNSIAFTTAPIHSLESAVWNIFMMAGITESEVLDPNHSLLKEIVILKHELHKDILINEGEEVPGASKFVRDLAANGLKDRLAIASTAIRPEIELFLDKFGLRKLFPYDRVISRESIAHPKPDPEAFNLAFESLGIPESDRSRVCAFEDDPRGITSAKSAGLYTCAITTRLTKKELSSLTVPPDLIADSFQEFTRYFGLA